ncbi:MAG: hypothetical protein VYC34_03175, partial [Planctomycetota bacterium]|nr:hypothetical protein [Planctomycetota bacterium]
LVIIGVMSWYLFMLAPQMNTDLQGYWTAAETGEFERASELKASFDSAHPVASNGLKSLMFLVLGLFGLGLWSATDGGNRPDTGPLLKGPEVKAKRNDGEAALEEPALLRGRR